MIRRPTRAPISGCLLCALVLLSGCGDPAAERSANQTQPVTEAAEPTRDISASTTFQEELLPTTAYSHHGVDVWSGEPGANCEGDSLYLIGRSDSWSYVGFGAVYLRFDLSAIPAPATIQSASLSLYAEQGYGNTQHIALHRVLSTWQESSLSWNNQPADWNNGQYENPILIDSIGRWWSWDASALVTAWQADPASNFGLSLIPIDSLYDGDYIMWRSDDHATVSTHPKLEVSYSLPDHVSRFVSQQVPPALVIGQRLEVEVVFANDGFDTWSSAAGYELASQDPPDHTTWGPARIALPAAVAPGAQAVFRFEITAPATPGTYPFRWQMVHNGGPGFFGELSPRLDIPVDRLADGLPCAQGPDCQSGECVDGVCCETACAGECLACNLPGQPGSCAYIEAGADPDEECAGTGPCGAACDGAGACGSPPQDTRCADCARCDGAGSCTAYDPADSDPTGACGLCRACTGAGPECAELPPGVDPKDECQPSDPTSCGPTGDCDGFGHCALHPAGTECRPASCQDGAYHAPSSCDGEGSCVDRGGHTCLPYVCLDAFQCRTDCSDDSHCGPQSTCSGGVCSAYLARGEACEQDAQCLTGACADRVCCDSACGGVCERCDDPADPGGCLPLAPGEDPAEECPGTGLCGGVCDGARACSFTAAGIHCAPCERCDGLGYCRQPTPAGSDPDGDCPPCSVCSGGVEGCLPADPGLDPKDDCPAEPPEGCGLTGTCDGAGACAQHSTATVCVPASCADGVLAPADRCDGLGACLDAGLVDCAPYACASAEACRTDCTQDDHCLPDAYCRDSSCRHKADLSTPCLGPEECLSGFCVDGVCCRTGCDAACHRCDQAGSAGECTALASGDDPDDECPGGGACGGACDGAGGCAFPGADQPCGPCARCDGLGDCNLLVPAGQDPLDACGPCRVCAGDRDACVAVPAGTDPLEECGLEPVAGCGRDGACNGRGACRLYPAGIACGAQSCIGDTLNRPPLCDGAGHCLPQDSLGCSPYPCEGDSCGGPLGLVRVEVQDEAGVPVGTRQLSTDERLSLQAVGLDAAGAVLGPVVVAWWVEGDIGSLPFGPSSAAVFDPTTPGSGWVVAEFPREGVVAGRAGELIVTPGVASGEIPLVPEPHLLPADGTSRARVTGGPVHDADGNPVSDATLLTVLASAGSLGSSDVDPTHPGLQRATHNGGLFDFEVVAASTPARSVLRAVAVPPGTARGEAELFFGDGRPVADAGADLAARSGTEVMLDGSGSWDPLGRLLRHEWSQTAGPAVELGDPADATPSFVAPQVIGSLELRFSLQVSAGGETSDPDEVLVLVLGEEPDRPKASIALEPPAGPAPLAVALDGSGSTAAECCQLVSYTWTFADGAPAQTGAQAERIFANPGGVGVALAVIDDQGHFDAASALVAVLGADDNQPPLLALSAVPDRGPAPLTVQLQATVSDPDAEAVTLEWDFGAGFTAGEPTIEHLFTGPGVYSIRARATDARGLATHQAVLVAVSRDGRYPPRILTTPPVAGRAREAWGYQPAAVGDPPLAWSLGKEVDGQPTRVPPGMTIDPDSGAIEWTPQDDQIGPAAVTLVVANPEGSDFQDFSIEVRAADGAGSGCGCGGMPTGTATAAWLLGLGALRARRRRSLKLR